MPHPNVFGRLLSYLSIGAGETQPSTGRSPAGDEGPDHWPVRGELLGKLKRIGQGRAKASNMSGIASIEDAGFPRRCLVVDDETQFAQIAIVNEGEIVAGDVIPLIDDRLDGQEVELDGEGVAYDDGAFYVIGSHGRPRDKKNALSKDAVDARIAASGQLLRIAIDPATIDPQTGSLSARPKVESTRTLIRLFRENAQLRGALHGRLDHNGLTIEGVAVKNGRLYAGLRGPTFGNGTKAGIFSAAVAGLFGETAPLPRLKLLDLGQDRGVRDLVRFNLDFLILAGPSCDPPEQAQIPDGAYSVFFWDGGDAVRLVADLAGYQFGGKWVKPEAVLPLDHADGKLRLLVLFDGAEQGGSRVIVVDEP